MTKDEVIRKIEDGSDILFDVCGKHFAVFTWFENGIGTGEQYSSDSLMFFATAAEPVEGFTVNGVALGEPAADMIITDYT